MGQYFSVYTKTPGGDVMIYNPKDPKIWSFSCHKAPFAAFIASLIYKNPLYLCVSGDESDDEETSMETCRVFTGYDPDFYEREGIYHSFDRKDTGRLYLYGKFVVNHTKNEYLDYDRFAKQSKDENDVVANPVIMLTLDGGSYLKNKGFGIGAWCNDLISVEDAAPEGYTLKDYSFRSLSTIQIRNITPECAYYFENKGADEIYRYYSESELGKITQIAEDLDWFVFSPHDGKIELAPLGNANEENVFVDQLNMGQSIVDLANSYDDSDNSHEMFKKFADVVAEEVLNK